MPSSRYSQAISHLIQRDRDRLERRAYRSLREFVHRLNRAVYDAFTRWQDLRTVIPAFREHFEAILVTISIIAHGQGRFRSGQTAVRRIRRTRRMAFESLYAEAYNAAQQASKLTPEQLRDIEDKYGQHASITVGRWSEAVSGTLAQTMEEIIRDGVHVTEGVSRLKEAMAKIGVDASKPWLIETMVRDQIGMAYMAGKMSLNAEPAVDEILWGYEYVTAGDDRVRPEHEGLNGVRLPKDDPRWKRIMPPNGFNCRCDVIEIFKDQTDLARPNPPKDVIEIDGKKYTPGPDKGWGFNPGDLFRDVYQTIKPTEPAKPAKPIDKVVSPNGKLVSVSYAQSMIAEAIAQGEKGKWKAIKEHYTKVLTEAGIEIKAVPSKKKKKTAADEGVPTFPVQPVELNERLSVEASGVIKFPVSIKPTDKELVAEITARIDESWNQLSPEEQQQLIRPWGDEAEVERQTYLANKLVKIPEMEEMWEVVSKLPLLGDFDKVPLQVRTVMQEIRDRLLEKSAIPKTVMGNIYAIYRDRMLKVKTAFLTSRISNKKSTNIPREAKKPGDELRARRWDEYVNAMVKEPDGFQRVADKYWAVRHYVGDGYAEMRKIESNQPDASDDPKLRKMTRDLSEFLSRAPLERGIFYRGMGLSDANAQRLLNARTVETFAFISTTDRNWVAQNFAAASSNIDELPHAIVLKIKTERAVRIMEIGAEGENERLIERGNLFKVNAVKKLQMDHRGVQWWQVEIEDLTSKSNVRPTPDSHFLLARRPRRTINLGKFGDTDLTYIRVVE